MTQAHTHIEDTLKSLGYRITAPRKKIIQALRTARDPKTAKEIARHTHIADLSTVYRTLRELVKEGLASEFADKGVSYFEVCEHHHDHAVCDGCGTMLHIPCMQTQTPHALKGWEALSHQFVWRGMCGKCT
jgi:Fe2+ or Zn2+ uptake regulation protein